MAVWMNGKAQVPPAVSIGQGSALGLNFTQGCWIGEDCYFADWRHNAVFRMHRGGTEATYVTQIPLEKRDHRFLFFDVVVHDGWMYFLPTNTHEIWAWNRAEDTWKQFPIAEKHAWHEFVWFTQAFRIGDDLWLKPVNYGAVVRFHLPTQNLKYFTGWGKNIHAAGQGANSQYASAGILVGSDLWFGGQNCGCIVRFSTKDGSSETYDVPEAKTGISNLAYDGKAFWLYAKTDDLLQWSPHDGVKHVLPQILADYPDGGWVVCGEGKVWVFAHWADAYVRYDPATGKMFQRDHYLSEGLRSGIGCAQIVQDGDDVCILPNFGDLVIHFDLRTETATARPVFLAAESEARFVNETCPDPRRAMDESEFYDAREMVLRFLKDGADAGSSPEGNEQVGQRIYGTILKGER